VRGDLSLSTLCSIIRVKAQIKRYNKAKNMKGNAKDTLEGYSSINIKSYTNYRDYTFLVLWFARVGCNLSPHAKASKLANLEYARCL